MGWLETRKVPVLFAVATLLPMVALCWLAVRALDQDRQLERQRRRERLEVAGARAAVDIERELQGIEKELSEGVGVRLLATGLVATEDEPILFQPDMAAPLASLPDALDTAARQEARHPAAAIAAYERLTTAPSAIVRGEALVALGGLYRAQHRFDAAIRAYVTLEQLGHVRVAGGQPASLVAHQGRLKTFNESGDQPRVREEAIGLGNALLSATWPIDQATFEWYETAVVQRWGGPVASEAAVRRTTAAVELWNAWRQNELPPRGRRFVGGTDPSTLALWVPTSAGPVAALFTPEALERRLRSTWQSRGLTAVVSRGDGRTIFGARADSAVVLSPVQTQLPFQLAVTGGDSEPRSLRSSLWISGVVLACALMITAAYGLYRITARELQLARQQSDFVAAVSHEFRTPLTSMRHLLDLLSSRGISDEARKQSYYRLLTGETERLQRMVETLLSFGRIDAGAQIWKLEPLDVTDLIHNVVDQIGPEFAPRPVIVTIDPGLPPIHADREALGRAVWNLLENAAKYSPGNTPVRVFGRRNGDTVLIGVQDQGIGIPVSEHERIFQKFVRGNEARRSGIRGVGVGLTLVKRIVEAHGGTVSVTSEVGAGSTFTLVLPVAG